MKRKISAPKRFANMAFLALLLCAVFAQGALAASGSLTQNSAVYSTASNKSKKIQTLKKDTVVELLSQTKSFYKVKTPDGKTGYILKSCVTKDGNTKSPAVATAAPAVDYNVNTSGDADIDELLALINEAREAKGIAPFTFDSRLLKGSTIRANEALKKFSHTRPNDTPWSTIFAEINMDPSALSENIAGGYKKAQEVFDGWNKSELHRKNMMNPKYTHIGLGKASGSGVQYDICWVALFTE